VNSCRTFRHICKSNEDEVFRLCYGKYGNMTIFFFNWLSRSSLHCFFALIFLFVKGFRQWRQIWEAMKWQNVNYGKKLKRWSDEAFNAGKEIEAMKRLTLHRITSLLHCFITFVAQLCLGETGIFLLVLSCYNLLIYRHIIATKIKFFGFVTENMEIWWFFYNWQSKSSLHWFFALIFLFVKAFRQWRQIWEAMKRQNVNYGKKLKRWSV
jgi:uncharacterized membrane protein